jgi:hypothetical protein
MNKQRKRVNAWSQITHIVILTHLSLLIIFLLNIKEERNE